MTKLVIDSTTNLNLVQTALIQIYGSLTLAAQLAFAQAIVESALLAAKPSALALTYCNLFGMKPSDSSSYAEPWYTGKGTKGNGLVTFYTHEYINGQFELISQTFLANNAIEDSIQQYKKLIDNLPRYHNLKEATDFISAANMIRDDGYCTDPHYPQELIDVYNEVIKGRL